MLGCTGRGAGAPSPADPRGCYVIRHAVQEWGEPTDFLFPYFFGLDSADAARVDGNGPVPGRRILLPRDDLNRYAGSWWWEVRADSLILNAESGGSAYRLVNQLQGTAWQGRLTATADGEPLAVWRVAGNRTACPPQW
jgi:hypothetical protein